MSESSTFQDCCPRDPLGCGVPADGASAGGGSSPGQSDSDSDDGGGGGPGRRGHPQARRAAALHSTTRSPAECDCETTAGWRSAAEAPRRRTENPGRPEPPRETSAGAPKPPFSRLRNLRIWQMGSFRNPRSGDCTIARFSLLCLCVRCPSLPLLRVLLRAYSSLSSASRCCCQRAVRPVPELPRRPTPRPPTPRRRSASTSAGTAPTTARSASSAAASLCPRTAVRHRKAARRRRHRSPASRSGWSRVRRQAGRPE